MPIEVGIWRLGTVPERVQFSSLEAESKLEDAVCADLSLIDPDLLLVGRQVSTAFGKFIDILALDAEGNLVILELKRGQTPREVIAQAIDYATWVATLTYDDVARVFGEHNGGKRLEEAFAVRFGSDPPERLNESHRMIVVASAIDASTERIVGYLANRFGVPINVVFFSYFRTLEGEFLVRSWLIDPNVVESRSTQKAGATGSKEPWNGRDFYVSVGEGPRRSWEDMRRYGFVSAGGGKWYKATLNQLAPGVRVFACIPQTGYVGVGTVVDPVVPISEFRVDLNGDRVPILSVPLLAPAMGQHAEDPDLAEHVVRVEWQATRPIADAIWEKGMFANQNSACKLRSSFTLERLAERFGLEE